MLSIFAAEGRVLPPHNNSCPPQIPLASARVACASYFIFYFLLIFYIYKNIKWPLSQREYRKKKPSVKDKSLCNEALNFSIPRAIK